MTHSHTTPEVDPIDVLVPSLRPRWQRLAIGAVMILGVGITGYLWQSGHLRPSPDCCGSGHSDSTLTLTEDESAVTVTAFFFNSSGVDIEVKAASADLPAAQVLQVNHFGGSSPMFPPTTETEYPVVVAGHESRWFAVTFIPKTCVAITGDWGTLTLELAVADSWLPTIDRTYTLPEPLVAAGASHLTTPQLDPSKLTSGPLSAACALLNN